jgi:intron-binding protein aquarius
LCFKITTVDKYQGQQNDYILLSLVRTKTVGHIRDVRRLVVGLSRARLGLYVFARVSLFQNCYELSNAFKLLMQRPSTLHLIPAEEYLRSSRKIGDITTDDKTLVIEDMPQMVAFVYQFYQQKIDEWKTTKPEVFERLVDKSSDNTAAEDTDSKAVDETAGDEGMGEENDSEDEDEREEELAFEKLTEDDTGAEDIAVDIEVTADQ